MLSPLELDFARLAHGRLSLQSRSIVDIAISTLFRPAFQSRALEHGDEVVVSCLSSPVVVDALIRYGLKPVFVDVCLPTFQVLLEEVEEAIDPNMCGAICLPHIYGNPFGLAGLRDLADEYGLWLLSESSFGMESDDYPAGSLEDISLYLPQHSLLTTSQMVYDVGRKSYLYGYSQFSGTDVIDLRQDMSNAAKDVNADTESFGVMHTLLSRYNKFFVLPESKGNITPAWSVFPITLTKHCEFSRADLLKSLSSYALPTTVWYEFRDQKRQHQRMYGIENVINNTVLLPLENVSKVVAEIEKFMMEPVK